MLSISDCFVSTCEAAICICAEPYLSQSFWSVDNPPIEFELSIMLADGVLAMYLMKWTDRHAVLAVTEFSRQQVLKRASVYVSPLNNLLHSHFGA